MDMTIKEMREWRRYLPQFRLDIGDVKVIDWLVGEVMRYKKDPEKYFCPSGPSKGEEFAEE